ncbi:HAMP domain-containing sensor histidine kinase [Roseisolibacter sp. H3M3-2]|uniref:sensor histidine kinase n=1 Tax=Roseisolibacter sp. H3M3-2 TaxID=3031323 RepID=UPI0023DB4B4C|nr:HAMP domain-containing sensor histidine kinase [Roseisolibacter sp. H3M3-2]MDF1503947.1 HAMP domain-containing sensor histidine kinase [Roseisolibacter sp. H3M3-2]
MIELDDACPLAHVLAARLRDAREELTRRWLERIAQRANLPPNEVFPTEDLLDHVPLLFDGIADFMENPAREVAGDAPVVGKAMELGALRHEQGFGEYELLKEYEIFGGILFAFLVRTAAEIDEPCDKGELLVCAHRLFRAVALIQQASVIHFLQLAREQVAEREDRLRTFNRAVTHEFKNQIGAARGAIEVLAVPGLPDAERGRLLEVVDRNVASMARALENLVELSQIDPLTGDAAARRRERLVPLASAVREAVRQLRDAASAAGVTVRVAQLPAVPVSAAPVELAVTNFVSNAIKYRDPAAEAPWVEVRAWTVADPPEVVVEVADNGLGVPADRREQLFRRGFRAHTDTVTGVEGTGLGLSIVKDAAEAVGGRVWAEFPDRGGSRFAVALPARRAVDGHPR